MVPTRAADVPQAAGFRSSATPVACRRSVTTEACRSDQESFGLHCIGCDVDCNLGGPISSEPRINDRIRVPEVRLVGPEGEQVGIVPIGKALELAAEADLDLVEVAPMARPPVCKLMDFGKFKYESAQKAREARRNQALTVIKEMKLRPKIDPHDYETKKGHVERFLKAGDKVKITIMFRGREQSRPELGFRLLQRAGRGHHRTRLRGVLAQAGRPQHGHGRRAAPRCSQAATPRRPRRPLEARTERRELVAAASESEPAALMLGPDTDSTHDRGMTCPRTRPTPG